MKIKLNKTFSLITMLLLCFILTSCNNVKVSKEITYDDLYNSNMFDSIFEKYENVSYTLTDSLDSEKSYNLFCSKDAFVLERENYVRVTYKDNDYYYDKNSKEFYKVYNVTEFNYRENHGDWCIIYNKKGDETVSYFKENKDTYSLLITLTGETAEKEIAYLTNKKLISNEKIVYDVVVNKDDLLVKEFSEYIVNDVTNKKTKCAKVSNIKYNTSTPRYINMAIKLENELQELKEEQIRTITIIKNPNTSSEEKIIFKTKKGEANYLLIAGDDIGDSSLNYECFENRACTIPYSFDANNVYDDIVIYLKEIK